MELEGKLAHLLRDTFSQGELRRFLRHFVSSELADELPNADSASASEYAGRTAEGLLKRGLLSRELLDAWARQRPKRRAEILALLTDHVSIDETGCEIPSPGCSEQPSDELVARIAAAEVPWTTTVREVVARVERGESVVVLAPRKAGSGTFTRQLCDELSSRATWSVVRVSARPLPDENVGDYLGRMRSVMGLERVTRDDGRRLVACIDGWSQRAKRPDGTLTAHLESLGNELRARMEGSTRDRPFTMVAVGGYPLFLLRYQYGAMSALNSASEVVLPPLSGEQTRALMEQIAPGRWTSDDADEVLRRSGGHPYLTKLLLDVQSRTAQRSWQAIEAKLDDDRGYVVPSVTWAAREPDIRRALRRCLERDDGIPLRLLHPNDPGHYLLWAGLLTPDGKRLRFRCEAIRRVVRELFEEEE